MFILLTFIKFVKKGDTNNNLDSSLPYLVPNLEIYLGLEKEISTWSALCMLSARVPVFFRDRQLLVQSFTMGTFLLHSGDL